MQKPIIEFTTDADECFLIGTKDELTSFANMILTEIKNIDDISMGEIMGIEVMERCKSYTEPLASVCLQNLIVTSNTQDTKKLTNRLRISSGDAPIAKEDWLDEDGKPIS